MNEHEYLEWKRAYDELTLRQVRRIADKIGKEIPGDFQTGQAREDLERILSDGLRFFFNNALGEIRLQKLGQQHDGPEDCLCWA